MSNNRLVSESERLAVVAEFREAAAAGMSARKCYSAAIRMLQTFHPSEDRRWTAAEAVRIITNDEVFWG
jgi:hypothetical protein